MILLSADVSALIDLFKQCGEMLAGVGFVCAGLAVIKKIITNHERMKEAQESFSHQESGTGSMTESLQKEKVVKAREVAGQSVGHFIGKVAGGKPPYFNIQFNMCKFIDKDIPAFSKPVNLGDGKEELEYDIMEEIVSQHYLSIISKVNAILEDVKNKTETDNKNKEKNMPKDHNHKAWKE